MQVIERYTDVTVGGRVEEGAFVLPDDHEGHDHGGDPIDHQEPAAPAEPPLDE